jgi:hypothetical protein
VDGAIADLFLHGRPAQVVAQFGVPGQDDRERAAAVGHHFHEPFEARRRLTKERPAYGRLCYTHDMAKISMVIPDDQLAKIDAEANGNRTAFMVSAAIEVAKRTHRERIDREIAADIVENADADAQVYSDWESTLADGLDEVE